MTLKFETWLSDQQAREDEIGALARTPRIQAYEAKPSKRSNDEPVSYTHLDGYKRQEHIPPDHFGLAMMRERATAVGASLTIISRPGEGTAVIIRRPAGVAGTAG